MALLVAAILAVSFFHLLRPIRDNDFFWHLKTGEWIWQHGEIPVKDPFSFPTEGLESIRERVIMTSPWLSQVIFWGSYAAAGMPGIVLLRFAIIFCLVIVMMKRREGDGILYAGLLLLFLSMLLKSYPVERPQVFSFLFFALLLFLLEGRKVRKAAEHADRRYDRSLFITLPLLMLVWANMHAGYVTGMATIVLFIFCEGLKFASPSLRPMERSDYHVLALAGMIGVLASFINPNTYRIFADNILFQYDYVTFSNIEFQSTVRIFRRYHDYSVLIYWGILALSAVGLLVQIKKINITEASLLAATGFFSFTSVRYIAFFMIAALPAVGRLFSVTRLLNPARALILAAALAAAIFFTRDHLTLQPLSSGKWVDGERFPAAAADFILTNNLKGNMYNYFDWGGYLIWRLAPERKVFIDGRTLYPHTYHQSDLIDRADDRRLGSIPAWKMALDTHNIQYTITPSSLPLVRALSQDRDWIPVFFRYNTVIFVRDTPENRAVTDKYSIDRGQLSSWLTQ